MQSALATKSAFHGNVHAFQATRNASAAAPSRGQLQVGVDRARYDTCIIIQQRNEEIV